MNDSGSPYPTRHPVGPVGASRRLAIVFSSGMRTFFLAAGLYALAAIAYWLVVLTGLAAAPASVPPAEWHAHEMIFGYAGAAIAGFFLTAVPSWTGLPSARGVYVIALAVAWLAGRVAFWGADSLPAVAVAGLDLLFLPLLAAKIGLQLIERPKRQNLIFLLLLALLWAGNIVAHLDWSGLLPGLAGGGLRLGLLTVAAMIAIIGGRVVPAFTRNALLRAGIETGLPVMRPRLDAAGIALAVLAGPAATLLPARLAAVVLAATGAVQLARLSGWRWHRTLKQPILWSLHLAFLMLGLGYLALAGALAGLMPAAAAFHLLGIGAIGGMTLAMMTRAALGHTGRPLVVARPIGFAYLCVALAALARIAAELVPAAYGEALALSGALWLVAFSLYVLVYAPILTTPRQNAAA